MEKTQQSMLLNVVFSSHTHTAVLKAYLVNLPLMGHAATPRRSFLRWFGQASCSQRYMLSVNCCMLLVSYHPRI